MGRPVNKNKLTQLVALVNGGAKQVVSQKGSKRFVLDDGNVYKLVTGAPGTGEMNLRAYLPDNSTITVAKISSRKITGSNGNTYGWNTSNNKVTPATGFVWIESWYYYND